MKKILLPLIAALSIASTSHASLFTYELELEGNLTRTNTPAEDPLPFANWDTWKAILRIQSTDGINAPSLGDFFSSGLSSISTHVSKTGIGGGGGNRFDNPDAPSGNTFFLEYQSPNPTAPIFGWTVLYQLSPTELTLEYSHDAGGFESYIFSGPATSIIKPLPAPDSGSSAALALCAIPLFIAASRLRHARRGSR